MHSLFSVTRSVGLVISAITLCIQSSAQNKVCAKYLIKSSDSLALTLSSVARLAAIESSDVDTSGKSTVWTYVYFSFDTSNIHNSKAYYIIGQNNQVIYDHSDSLGVGPAILFAWWMDSDSAVTVAQHAGGSDICRRFPGCTIAASLFQWPAPPFISEWRIAYHYSDSVRTIRVNGTNGQIITGILAPQISQPLQFQLRQNYPNPFNPSTTIEYFLPTSAFATLRLYDLLGRQIRVLAEGMQIAGTHAVVLNANGLTSGVYFYQLRANNELQTKKLLILK
jgi:hypothetical protein